MVAYKHLVLDPVFECDGLLYARVDHRRAVVLKHYDGTPIAGFNRQWRPVFLYTGLSCLYFLGLEEPGAQASWILAPDGRRLGDKLADLPPGPRQQLHDAVVTRGLATVRGLIGDGLQCIESGLLADILALAGTPDPAVGMARSEATLSMLSAPHRLHTQLRYRPGETGLDLGEGWRRDASGLRATGEHSVVQGDARLAASRSLLSLGLAPCDAPQTGRPAEIEIMVNGAAIGTVRLDPHWQAEGAEVAFWLAPERIGGSRLEIAFRHAQDFMLTSLRLEQALALEAALPEPRELMLRFENLGDNCEFGLVQRHFGAEPVGLLRFAGLRTPRRLIRFLDEDFGSFGEPGSLKVTILGGEYWIVDQVYGIAYHTFQYPHEIDADTVIRENEVKASYLRRKFREDLEDGEKILVYKRVVTRDPHEILALHAAVNRLGTVNKLLWVTQADPEHAAGTVEWVGDRLLKGYVGRISLQDAHDFDAEQWLVLCRNAFAAFASLPLSAAGAA